MRSAFRRPRFVVAAAVAVGALIATGLPTAAVAPAQVQVLAPHSDRVLLFAADGLRQDIVQRYAAERGGVPGFSELLKNGAAADDGGMLTQAPPNTGAGWYTMATGAWPAVHGSTNNTFFTNSPTQPFANRTAAFDSGVLSAETIAQAAERGGKRVIQMEWAGGRNGTIEGPTVDFRTFLSGRGVTTNFVSPSDRPALITSFGLQYDQVDLAAATGWSNVPPSHSPALETHMRVLDFGVDKYGLDAYVYDSTDDGTTNYDRVCSHAARTARTRWPTSPRASWPMSR
jgi:Type I phosphodiesterase / nucleotide pyrophosphatase